MSRFHMGARLAAVVLASLLVAGAVPMAPVSQAAAPPPPLDACLDGGSFNIADPVCLELHKPSSGDWFGPISGVVTRVASRGDTIGLSFSPGVDVFFDRAISCGIGGCIYHGIPWRPEEGFTRGLWMEPVRGCTGADLECTFRIWPDYDLGDAAERWWVLYAQHYRGIFPQKGVAHAIYVPPRYYPVRLDSVDGAGRAVEPRPGTTAYAVREGRSSVAGACAPVAWWQANRRVINPPIPDCVVLAQTDDDVGLPGYEGVLPVDSGRWSIVVAPAGASSVALTARPSPYRATTVEPTGDDLRIPVVRERRPLPQVTVVPATAELPLGGTAEVQVTVAAVDGEVGSITLTFDDPSVLAVTPLDPPIVGLAGADTDPIAPIEPFTLAQGQEQAFIVTVAGLGEGEADLVARVSGFDDVGDPVAADGGASVVVSAASDPGSGDGLEPPVVDVAVTGEEGGRVAGIATGAPGSTLTVTLWASIPAADGTCEQRQSGAGTAVVGSAEVTLDDAGTGSFSFEATLTEGWFTYGVAAVGARVSRIGECRQIVGDTPVVSVTDTEIVEGTAVTGTTALTFTIALSQASDLPVSVRVTTSDGSATSPADFAAVDAIEVTVAPGETAAQLTVEVAPDADAEEDETVTLTLSDPVNGRLPAPDALGPGAEATGTIVDDDATAVTETPDVRGTWRWVFRVRDRGRVLEAPYTITITRQDPDSGKVQGRIVVDSYDPFPTYRGKVTGTVQGDDVHWKVTGTGAVDGPIDGRLVRQGDRLAIKQDQGGKVTFVLIKPGGD